jgi:hypothetical protein
MTMPAALAATVSNSLHSGGLTGLQAQTLSTTAVANLDHALRAKTLIFARLLLPARIAL